MFRATAFWVVLAVQAPAETLAIREVTSQAALLGGQPIPRLYEGYVLFVDSRRNHIRVYAPDGQLFLETDVQDTIRPSVMSIAVDKDGTVAASWAGFAADGKRCAGIDFLDRTGQQIRWINTGYYLAKNLAFGEAHSLWTFGWERDSNDPERAAEDYMTLRRYVDGHETAAYLPRSLFPKGLQPACLGWQRQGIAVASDRIGLAACSGQTSANVEWVELDLTGKVMGRWKLAYPDYLAFTSDGHLYVQDSSNKALRLTVLDRPSSTFKAVEGVSTEMLYGADGDKLVFVDRGIGAMHVRWFKQP